MDPNSQISAHTSEAGHPLNFLVTLSLRFSHVYVTLSRSRMPELERTGCRGLKSKFSPEKLQEARQQILQSSRVFPSQLPVFLRPEDTMGTLAITHSALGGYAGRIPRTAVALRPPQNFCKNLRTRSRSRTLSISSLSQMI